MNLIEWTKTDEALPPEWQVVETLSEGGVQQQLRRVGEGWFFPQGSADFDVQQHVNITFWRPITKETE